MTNRPRVRVPAAALLPLLLFASATLAMDQSRPGQIVIVAMATDVQTIVARDVAGHLASFAVGEVIEGSGWQLAHVSDSKARLQATRLRDGAIVSMLVGVGQRIHAAPVELAPKAQARSVRSSAVQSQSAEVAQDDKR